MSGVPPLHRALAGVAALALGLVVTGCSTGSNALTNTNYTSADGVKADSGLVGVRNLVLVSDGTGATLSGAVANNGTTADSVVSVATGTEGARLVAGTGLAIPTAGLITFGLAGTGPQAFFTGKFSPGLNVTVTVTFQHAAPLTLRVPVLPRDGYYTAVPAPSPTASAAGA